MKKKTVWITAAILCLVAVIFVLVQVYRSILIEGTITDDQGNAMNGVSAYVTFSRKKAGWYSGTKELEETVDSSFRFEGKGDAVFVVFAKKGYAPGQIQLDRGRGSQVLRRDLRIVMKELTPEELEKRFFRTIYEWSQLDVYIDAGEKMPTTEDQLERLRKYFGLEKSDMTDLFVKAIREGVDTGEEILAEVHFVDDEDKEYLIGPPDDLSGIETKSEKRSLRERYFSAMRYLQYYPPPQQQFLELIRKAVELEPESADTLILSYTKAYPDWVFDDGTILELTCKSDMEEFNLREAGSDLRVQVRQENDEARRKKLLDKAFEWAFQDDKVEIFHYLDRLLLDHYDKDYATNPGRKLQLEKDLKRHEEAEIYDWVYRRTKYALEHFDEGDEALEMLYKLDTDPKRWDGEWERSERKRRIRESIEEWKKEGNDPSYIFSEDFLERIYKDE
ncbi:MAG: hypothetical protein J6Y92_02260 [Lentisphaeria bacterium]|nr:hypothetical protein [Lentisphaeria bacterium]